MTPPDYKTAEQNAPVVRPAVLPLTVPTLQFTSPDNWDQYVRSPDGSFSLDYIHASDNSAHLAYNDQIASGQLRVFPDGVTRAMVAAQEAQAAATSSEVFALLADDAAKQKAARVARADAYVADQTARARAHVNAISSRR